MKLIHPLLIATLSLSTLNSCIQDEPLNAECDITGVDETWYNHYAHLNATEQNPEGDNIWIGKVKINEETHRISFTVKLGTDRSSFAPVFNLMPYTRITAKVNGEEVADANGITRDFTTPQIYTTHSQDGNWHKDYTVAFNYPMAIGEMNFSSYKVPENSRYYTWYEKDEDGNELDYWATGNGGYIRTGIAKTPEQYPTAPILDENGIPAVKLDNKRPIRLEGDYKYKAGDVFKDINKTPISNRRDKADIYAVVYEVDPNNFQALDGDNVLTSDRIVLMARIDNPGEPQDWTHFSEPFMPKNGKTFDADRLARNGYAIAVVATSSRDGAYFEGAVGSTLYVRQLKVVYED